MLLDEELDTQIEQEEVEVTSEEFIPFEITTYPSDFTLWGLYEKWKANEIIIPHFQRSFVWDIKRASLLVESFYSGLPVPNVFFYIDNENRNIVVDGQQRLLSIFYFFDGFFGPEDIKGRRRVFKITGLKENHPLHDVTYDDIADTADGRKIKSSVMRAVNILQRVPNDDNSSIFHIFERLNTGSVALSAQEIRNCVFRGKFNDLLFKLNSNQLWLNLLGTTIADKRQKDIELILRVFALAELEKGGDYGDSMKLFLSDYMEKMQKREKISIKNDSVEVFEDELYHMETQFINVLNAVTKHLGEKPFRPKGKMNLSIFDAVFSSLLKCKDIEQINVKEKYDLFLSSFSVETYGTNSKTSVSNRINAARSIFLV